MMTTEFLYGVKPEELAPMKYYDALAYKYSKGQELFRALYLGNLPNENHRQFYVEKALRHTKKLINERKGIN